MAAIFGQCAYACGRCSEQPTPVETHTITFLAINPSNNLAFSTVNSVTVSTATNHIGTFSFDSIVNDGRAGTAGWSLEASSSGLTHEGGGHADINFNGATSTTGYGDASTNTGTPNDEGICGTTHVTELAPVETTASSFARADAVSTGPVNCLYTIHTGGYVDFTGQPAGSYSGDVTITLSSLT